MSAKILQFPVPTAPDVPANDTGSVTHERLVVLIDAYIPARPDLGAVDLYRDSDVALVCLVKGQREHESEWKLRRRLLADHVAAFTDGGDVA